MTLLKKQLCLVLLLCGLIGMSASKVHAQAQHFFGVKEGVSFTNISSSQPLNQEAIKSWMNAGLVYKYYSGKWVGLQAGVNLADKGYESNDTTKRYRSIEVPVVSQFHVELWKLRLMAQFGLYGAYILGADLEYADADGQIQKTTYTFQDYEKRWDCGTVFGAGLSVMLKPIEIQFEYNYHFGLLYMQDPREPGPGSIFKRHNQSIVSMGILVAF